MTSQLQTHTRHAMSAAPSRQLQHYHISNTEYHCLIRSLQNFAVKVPSVHSFWLKQFHAQRYKSCNFLVQTLLVTVRVLTLSGESEGRHWAGGPGHTGHWTCVSMSPVKYFLFLFIKISQLKLRTNNPCHTHTPRSKPRHSCFYPDNMFYDCGGS